MTWVMHERFLASTLIDESAFCHRGPRPSSTSLNAVLFKLFDPIFTAPDGCGHAATPKGTIFWHLWGIQTSKFRVHGYGMAPDIVGLLVLNLGGMPRLELKPSLASG
ncbi:unnamed protein product [Clonostachys rosea f. rosea IK726]|uniref:Uncharacterized protein n=1 Tax=Clonostachys rosea f. rosea IK726 TaxID=1349383 RepID=A0ACA9TAH0_BIOOC|nr:unnamed protein product [Clonostachys rosea f. rosea IK726]